MGKSDIVELLKNNKGKKYTVKQMSYELGISNTSVNKAVRNLRKVPYINYEYDDVFPLKIWYWYDETFYGDSIFDFVQSIARKRNKMPKDLQDKINNIKKNRRNERENI